MKNFFKNFFASFLGSILGVSLALLAALIIVPMLIFVIMASGRYATSERIVPHSILHLDITGRIVETRRPMGFSLFGEHSFLSDDRFLGLYELTRVIDAAKTDPRIDGIYVTIGDFESGWSNITALRRKLAEFTAAGKWVYVYADRMDEMGYYLASAANQIFMEPFGEIEFNGLAASETFIKGLLDKLELEPRIFRAGKFKAAIEPLTRENMSPENREQTQILIGDIWQEVRSEAARVTKLSPERIDQIASQFEVVSAEDAKNSKLIHETAFVDVVEDRMRAFTVGAGNELELVTPGRYLRDGVRQPQQKKKIAVIFAEGEIHSGESSVESIGSESFRQDLRDAKSDEDVEAIVLRINSPGGDALASDVIWRELRQSDDEMPVLVSMGNVAASGGYYIASAARFIYAEPTTITGSIGVFGVLFGVDKFFKSKAGVSFDRATTHPYSDLGSSTRPISPLEAGVIQKQVDRVYGRFIDVVKEGRGYKSKQDVEDLAEGRVWSGTRAKELGLVDELGGLENAIRKAAEYADLKDYSVVTYPAASDSWERLLERLAQDMSMKVFGSSFDQVKRVSETIDAVLRRANSRVRAEMLFDYRIR